MENQPFIDDLPIKNGGFPYLCKRLPEGMLENWDRNMNNKLKHSEIQQVSAVNFIQTWPTARKYDEIWFSNYRLFINPISSNYWSNDTLW